MGEGRGEGEKVSGRGGERESGRTGEQESGRTGEQERRDGGCVLVDEGVRHRNVRRGAFAA